MNASIVAEGVAISDALRSRIERRLYFALGRFATTITSVRLTLQRESSARRDGEKCCRIVVRSSATHDVVVEGRGQQTAALVDRTVDRAGRAVARALDTPWQETDIWPPGKSTGV